MLRRVFSITRSSAPHGEAPGRRRSWWQRLFAPHDRPGDIRHLPPYLLRDIGVGERRARDRERDPW